jgi:predicted transcriptional regulator
MRSEIKPRSRWDIILDILEVIAISENRAKKTRIMKKAYLDWRNFQRHFGFLIEGDFIEQIEDPSSKDLKSKLKDVGAIVAV